MRDDPDLAEDLARLWQEVFREGVTQVRFVGSFVLTHMDKFRSVGLRFRFLAVIALFLTTSTQTVNAQYKITGGTEVAPLDMFQECDVCPEMIVLPLGHFTMGGPIGDSINGLVMIDGKLAMVEPGHPAIGTDERPLHRVEIDVPIAMGRNEITHDQWMACVKDRGCGGHVPADTVFYVNQERRRVDIVVGGRHPVIDVSYQDIQAYVAWLNRKAGTDAYRLPTEAEWEYAARAGTQTRFAQGDELTADQANFYGRGTEKMTGIARPDLPSRMAPVPVDELEAGNAWGLRHMSGNVIERTRSCYTDEYAGWSKSSEWLRQSMVESCKRVSRGGSYNDAMDYARVASRGAADEAFRSRKSGFRIVRQLN